MLKIKLIENTSLFRRHEHKGICVSAEREQMGALNIPFLVVNKLNNDLYN